MPTPPTPNPIPRVTAVFDRLFDAVEQAFPDLGEISLHHDEAAARGGARQFAFCKKGSNDELVIAFALRAEALPEANLEGLLAHEFGHAVDFRYTPSELEARLGPLPKTPEARADAIAQHLLGGPVRYDDYDVQTSGPGVEPRPKHLAQNPIPPPPQHGIPSLTAWARRTFSPGTPVRTDSHGLGYSDWLTIAVTDSELEDLKQSDQSAWNVYHKHYSTGNTIFIDFPDGTIGEVIRLVDPVTMPSFYPKIFILVPKPIVGVSPSEIVRAFDKWTEEHAARFDHHLVVVVDLRRDFGPKPHLTWFTWPMWYSTIDTWTTTPQPMKRSQLPTSQSTGYFPKRLRPNEPEPLAEDVTDADIDPEQLRRGTAHEMEHTNDAIVAREIALDHLREIPDYYDRIDKLEERFQAGLKPNIRTSIKEAKQIAASLGFGDLTTKDTTPFHIWKAGVFDVAIRMGADPEIMRSPEQATRIKTAYNIGETVAGAAYTQACFAEGARRAPREDADREIMRTLYRKSPKPNASTATYVVRYTTHIDHPEKRDESFKIRSKEALLATGGDVIPQTETYPTKEQALARAQELLDGSNDFASEFTSS